MSFKKKKIQLLSLILFYQLLYLFRITNASILKIYIVEEKNKSMQTNKTKFDQKLEKNIMYATLLIFCILSQNINNSM